MTDHKAIMRNSIASLLGLEVIPVPRRSWRLPVAIGLCYVIRKHHDSPSFDLTQVGIKAAVSRDYCWDGTQGRGEIVPAKRSVSEMRRILYFQSHAEIDEGSEQCRIKVGPG